MKKVLFTLFILSTFVGVSQYYDTSAMRIIDQARTAYEGDMYLDTVNNVYRIGLTNGKLGYISKSNVIDSVTIHNDSLIVLHYFDGNKDSADISQVLTNSWKLRGNSGTNDAQDFIGTTDLSDVVLKTNSNEVLRLNDTGDIILANYPSTRTNSRTEYTNVLYTTSSGQLQSARREIVPPTAFINATTTGSNTFNYFNYYTAQMAAASLPSLPLAQLEFYVYSYDPAVFNNVSISTSGVLSYDVIATSTTKTFIDVRFFAK